MKKVSVLSVQPDAEGPTFGRVMDPLDFHESQDFAHAHIVRVVKDMLVAGAEGSQVTGFDATRTTGLGVSIGAGHVVDPDGNSYELDDAAVVAMNAADPAHARIDLVYATLAIDVPSNSEFKPFRQLHTLAELEAGASPYDGVSQFNEPTELHCRATIAVRAGTPGVSPAAPAAAEGEVPLWQVHVAAGQTVLTDDDLTDVRTLMKSLYLVLALLDPETGAELLSHKGVANGYAALDGSGKVPSGQIPAIFVLKAGDTMTGKLEIDQDDNNTFALEIEGTNTAKGISVDIEDGIILDGKIGGASAILVNGRLTLGTLLTLTKAINNQYLVDMDNPGGAAWGMRINVESYTVEPVLTLDSGVGTILEVLSNGNAIINGALTIGTVNAPTSKLQVPGLPVYANNAAALAAGLTVGACYRTGGNPDPVCVVH